MADEKKRWEVDRLLEEVMEEAKSLSIPISPRISEKVVINGRAKKRFGCCRKTPQGFVIELSEALLYCEEKMIKQVLAHEILHTCQGCYNHSPKWKAYAGLMNERWGYQIKRLSSREELGIPEEIRWAAEQAVKYELQCEKCGRMFRRQRKSRLVRYPNLYRCSCGGKLRRI